MEPIKHDPRTKQQIKDALFDYLYTPVKKEMDRKLRQLVVRNGQLNNNMQPCFLFRGEIYTHDTNQKMPRHIPRLHTALESDMLAYLTELKELNEYEVPFVLGFIIQVLNASNDLQDYLKMFPQSVHQPIRQLIDSCPCRNVHLDQETINEIQAKNELSISLMKQRQVLNLLI